MRKLLINIFGSPKSGKTTMMAAITVNLKLQGIKCEMATDYPKEILYEERFSLLKRQLYILAKQEKRIHDLYKFSDVVITDCPILHSLVYNSESHKTLHPFIIELHNSYNSLNLLMSRTVEVNYGCFKIFTPEQLAKIETDIIEVLEVHEQGQYLTLKQEPTAIAVAIKRVNQEIEEMS